jgi:hypothetical protein
MAETRNNLTKNQKLALIGLTVFGVFIIGLWVFTLNQQINNPLSENSSKNKANSANQSAGVSEEEKQKTADTDGDGLFDWDELNVYKTSPYIVDSDSDGISDGAEIANNTNPNCPEGKNCSTTIMPAANSATGATGEAVTASDGGAIDLLAGQSDAQALRQMLSDAGLDKATLDQISDEVLMNTYKDLIASSTKK